MNSNRQYAFECQFEKAILLTDECLLEGKRGFHINYFIPDELDETAQHVQRETFYERSCSEIYSKSEL